MCFFWGGGDRQYSSLASSAVQHSRNKVSVTGFSVSGKAVQWFNWEALSKNVHNICVLLLMEERISTEFVNLSG